MLKYRLPLRSLVFAAVMGSLLVTALRSQTTNLAPAVTGALAGAPETPPAMGLWASAREEWGFDYRGTLQFSTLGLLLSDRVNALIPDRWAPAVAVHAVELRLDLKASPAEWLDLGLDPRLRTAASQYSGGRWSGNSDAYLAGWLLQARPTEDTRMAWSRQNLQWGPSYLTSPSNPFGGDNGKNMPSVELPAMTYLKATWMPADCWAISALANVVGPRDPVAPAFPSLNLPPVVDRLASRLSSGDGFEPVYAIKNDFTFDRRTFSLIISKQETEDPRIGLYGSWNLSDAVILYAEGASDGQSDHGLLAGATYTFVDGSFVALEYYLNDTGPDSRRGLNALAAGPSLTVSDGFSSRHYLLLQYATTELINRATLAARWIVNCDQFCHRLAIQADYDLGNHASIFANAVVDVGGKTDEYGGLLKGLTTIGVHLLF